MAGWVKIPETWFEDDAVDAMSGDAVLLHLSALADCARNLRDGRLPERALRRLRVVDDQEAMILELITAGWWAPTEDGWVLRDWQTFILSATEVESRRSLSREASERYRRHKAGDHSMCERCSVVRDQSRHPSRDASRDQSRHGSVTQSVTPPVPIRSEPKVRGEERGVGPGSAGAAPADALPPLPIASHPYNASPECCPLPPASRVHQSAS